MENQNMAEKGWVGEPNRHRKSVLKGRRKKILNLTCNKKTQCTDTSPTQPYEHDKRRFPYFQQTIQGSTIIEIKKQDEIVGLAELVHNNCGGCGIGSVEVQAQYRDEGNGRKLIRRVERKARQLGCQNIVLGSEPESVGFWENLGYIDEGKEGGLHVMRKELGVT